MTPYIGSWKLRRRVVFGTLFYCAAMVTYLVIWGKDTSLNAQIGVALIGLAVMVIGSYVFGAVWDDKNIRNGGRQP